MLFVSIIYVLWYTIYFALALEKSVFHYLFFTAVGLCWWRNVSYIKNQHVVCGIQSHVLGRNTQAFLISDPYLYLIAIGEVIQFIQTSGKSRQNKQIF